MKTDVSTGNVTGTDVTIGTAYSAVSTSSTSQKAATIRQVAESISRWGGTSITDDGSNSVAGKRYVETVAPTAGVNDAGSADGDLWFVREA